jgi:hypothetical protein
VKDWDETDIDCGGSWCRACADGKHCLANNDCISTLCNPRFSTCSPATCLDSTKDGTETDVDCGGSNCPPCADGKQCLSNLDCSNDWCNPIHKCGPWVCNGAGCAYCNPTNPAAVCGADTHCTPQPDATSVCSYPAGTGTTGASCLSDADCVGPLACVGTGDPFNPLECVAWCTVGVTICPGAQTCQSLNPAVFIGSTEWGVCF